MIFMLIQYVNLLKVRGRCKNSGMEKRCRHEQRERKLQRWKERGWRDSVRLIQAHDSREVLFWLYSGCVHQQQESMASVATGNRLKYASQPPAHARLPKAVVLNIKSSYRVNEWLPRETTARVHRLWYTMRRVESGSYLCQIVVVSCPPIHFALG